MKTRGTPKAIWFQDESNFKKLKLFAVINELSIEQAIKKLLEIAEKTNENKEG